jgi:hypothetical protein
MGFNIMLHIAEGKLAPFMLAMRWTQTIEKSGLPWLN